jgi:nickel-type superoxide dismutase maturation protease
MDGAQTYHASVKRKQVVAVLVGALVAGGAAWSWWRWRPFRVAVEGGSMRPALEPSDWLVATRRGALELGAVVVVDHPDRPGFELVKRIAAAPGDLRPDGGGPLAPATYWVIGDHPDASTDSRTFGPVPGSMILGVVRFRYGPPSRFGRVDASGRCLRSAIARGPHDGVHDQLGSSPRERG